jgi:hypothetical protein
MHLSLGDGLKGERTDELLGCGRHSNVNNSTRLDQLASQVSRLVSRYAASDTQNDSFVPQKTQVISSTFIS